MVRIHGIYNTQIVLLLLWFNRFLNYRIIYFFLNLLRGGLINKVIFFLIFNYNSFYFIIVFVHNFFRMFSWFIVFISNEVSRAFFLFYILFDCFYIIHCWFFYRYFIKFFSTNFSIVFIFIFLRFLCTLIQSKIFLIYKREIHRL